MPAADSLLVQRMKAAGCIVIGKTNTPEFGLGSHTFNEVFGATRNAFDPTRSAGGSSGGAAVAIATRMLPVADGSDSMGSLRNPAAWNNVFGFRPSQGRVPNWPAQDVWVSHFGTEGPMARNVPTSPCCSTCRPATTARVPLSLDEASFAARPAPRRAPALRIGWLGDLDGHLAMEEGILDVCRRGLARLEATAAASSRRRSASPRSALWNAWLRCARYPLRPDLAAPGRSLRTAPDQARGALGARQRRPAQRRPDDAGEPRSQRLVSAWWPSSTASISSPCRRPRSGRSSRAALAEGDRRADDGHLPPLDGGGVLATFAGLPCVNVPVGFSAAGLPMGMQLIGRPRGDMKLLRLARDYERVAGDVLAVRPAE